MNDFEELLLKMLKERIWLEVRTNDGKIEVGLYFKESLTGERILIDRDWTDLPNYYPERGYS